MKCCGINSFIITLRDSSSVLNSVIPSFLNCQTNNANDNNNSNSSPEPISSLHQRRYNATTAMILVATPTRLYIFTTQNSTVMSPLPHNNSKSNGPAFGSSLLNLDSPLSAPIDPSSTYDSINTNTASNMSLLAAAAENLAQCVELPGSLGRSELRFHALSTSDISNSIDSGASSNKSDNYLLESIAWLTSPGIYHAKLQLILSSASASSHLSDRQLLQYADLSSSGRNDYNYPPLSIALTEYHFLLLYPMNLLVVNKKSDGKIIQELNLQEFR